MIPTFRRPGGLIRALEALAAQDDPGIPWEVLVVDNDPPGAREAFAAGAPGLPVPARLVSEPTRGSAYARNRGIREGAGDILAMLDDDVRPDRAWLGALVEPILAGRCEGVGGRVILDPSVAHPRWFDLEAIGGYLAHWDLATEERELLPGETVVTSNCAFRADLLRRTGGFDPALGPRQGTPLVNDDLLLTRRFLAIGGRVRLVPKALVVHDLPADRLRRRYLLRRAYAHGRSDWLIDRDLLAAARARGAGEAIRTLVRNLRRRRGEGLRRPEVAFHALCDVARAAGSLREAFVLLVPKRRRHPS